MSATMLYHAFGVKGYTVSAIFPMAGALIISIEQPREKYRCSACGSDHVHAKGTVPRLFRAVPIGSTPVFLEYWIPRVKCRYCGLERQLEVSFAEPKKSYTKSFACYVLELSQHMTIQGVATHLNVGWDLIKEIQQQNLEHRFSRPKLKHLKRIAVDEIYVGKMHKYLTLVLDLDSGRVVYVGDGKGQKALDPFWKRLRSSHAKIQAVAADLSPSYSAAIRKALPKASLVFDRFHLMKLLNERLTELRRELHREAIDMLHKDVLKGIRWLLLKNSNNLNDKNNERQRLREALHLNESLALAYYMKEELTFLWLQDDWLAAKKFLDDWIARAEASGIRQLQAFAKTLRTHETGILNWYDHPISTGPLEGTNNKIKLMQRQAYGYRDLKFFKLKLLAIHKSERALVG